MFLSACTYICICIACDEHHFLYFYYWSGIQMSTNRKLHKSELAKVKEEMATCAYLHQQCPRLQMGRRCSREGSNVFFLDRFMIKIINNLTKYHSITRTPWVYERLWELVCRMNKCVHLRLISITKEDCFDKGGKSVQKYFQFDRWKLI